MRIRLMRVLLDANVLVDAQLRDLLLRAAKGGHVDVRWSDQILEETRRALTNQLGLPVENVARLLDALNRAFPDARIAGYEAIVDTLTMPDPDDRHVLAAALHGECDILLTANTKDFPESALPSDADLLVIRPDDGLRTLVEAHPRSMAAIARRLVDSLRRPPTTLEQYVERLEQRAPIAATALGAGSAWRTTSGSTPRSRRPRTRRALRKPCGRCLTRLEMRWPWLPW
jgi:predicted nucleic acid-binding protein